VNLSFDPAHAWFEVPGLDAARWTVEVFTTENVYGIDPARTTFDGRSLTASGLQLLGGQRQAAGGVDATATLEPDGSIRPTIAVHAAETGRRRGCVRAKARASHVEGHVPALSVVHDTFTTHGTEARAFCQAVRRRS
jgi:hypothetical protein